MVDDDSPAADAKKATRPASTPPTYLIRDAQEQAVYSDLYRRQASPLAAFLVVAGASPEEAWDAVQSAFEKAWTKWPELPAALPAVKAWLRTTAYRDYLRATPKTDRRRSNEPVPDRPTTELSPDAVAVLAESTVRARSVLDKLPATQRLHLAWHLDGYSYSEIAKQTRKKEPAVRQNVSRAIRTLREVSDER